MQRILLALAFLASVLLAVVALPRDKYEPIFHRFSRFSSCLCSTSPHLDPILSPDMQASIERYVVQVMTAHAHGEREFARKANGGRVAFQVTSGYHGLFSTRSNDPSIAIDDHGGAGECWTTPPLPAQLGIRLSHVIRPSFVSVEHFPPNDIGRTAQAPQNVTLWGVVDGKVNTELYQTFDAQHPPPDRRAPSIAKGLRWAPLASFVYDINSPRSFQTFPIAQQYVDIGMSFGVFAFEIYSNWGASVTCLHKVGIHGTLI
ncbi:hypothetical protein K466DRAFT_590062 [Polyporus arcularius HHB13444]|uniref:SUN domain-containing protein n=1 Tax=Polyporus arcularius HHB13444 TaxID=1314778 RepID=A0A5C3P065_9APHY|nr:hypothetical protein K466DRAFT_590062 [Polyporus arcularius HHB13444]